MAGSVASIAKIENVLIRAGECAVTVLPQAGGKIASIRIGERELLQQPLAPIAPRTRTMAFDESDASGWDECLPSVAACDVKTEAGIAEIPDHGDLWRVEWQEQGSGTREQGIGAIEQTDASVALIGRCFSLPLELERRLDLSETKSGWQLKLAYKLTKHGFRHNAVVVGGASLVCGGRGRSDCIAGVDHVVAAGRFEGRTARQGRRSGALADGPAC